MSTKIKAALITFFLSFGLLPSLSAQDKYEYGSIFYSQWLRRIEISLSGQSYTKIDVSKDEVKGANDLNPAFKQLNKLLAEEWELITINTIHDESRQGGGQFFYIRRKTQ